MPIVRVALLAPLVALCPLAAGCSDPQAAAPLPLEVGIKAADGTFRPLVDGDTVRIGLVPMGYNTVMPSLRAVGIDPRRPEATVEVELGGHVMASNAAGARADMVDDGTGYVLWDLRAQFQTELCCYACSEATVVAHLRDNAGKRFEGQVTVQLDPGGGCPDVTACCAAASVCPDPALTHVCM